MPHFPHRLRFVEDTHEGYSTYVRLDTNETVHLQDGTARELRWLHQIDLDAEWHNYTMNTAGAYAYKFLDDLRESMIEPDEVDDEVAVCDDCEKPTLRDETTYLDRAGRTVCDETCLSDYFACDGCEEYAHNDTSTETLEDDTICQRCREYNYLYCDHCNGYRHEYSEDHYHDDEDDCDCDSPAQTFTFPHVIGEGSIDNDERIDLTLPEGYITDEAMGQITRLLQNVVKLPEGRTDWYERDEAGDYVRNDFGQAVRIPEWEQRYAWINFSYAWAETVGNEWQTSKGNFTRRLARAAHQHSGLRIPDALVSQIGNIARANSGGVDVSLELTRNLNLPAHDFFHEGSCWWTEYSESRCALKTNGGIGLRTFNRHGVSGRAWVMPMRHTDTGWIPTFDTNADGYIVFNGYGDLANVNAARIVATMTGLTYKRVNFTGEPMYVNADFGYLVTNEDTAKDTMSVRLYLDQHANIYNNERALAHV